MAKEDRKVTLQFAEDEQGEKIKRWWKTNGVAVIVGLVVGVGSVAGYQGWNVYQDRQTEAASDLYETMLHHVELEDIDNARRSARDITDNYASTAYADAALLMLARLDVEQDNLNGAENYLSSVVKESDNPVMRDIARLRLASLALDEGDFGRAQEIVSVRETEGFLAHFLELRGDIFFGLGALVDAENAYQEALTATETGSIGSQILNRKLNSVLRGRKPE